MRGYRRGREEEEKKKHEEAHDRGTNLIGSDHNERQDERLSSGSLQDGDRMLRFSNEKKKKNKDSDPDENRG